MPSNTSDRINTAERHTAHAVHYDLSYILQGAEHGTNNAIVLLHDFPAGAFAWDAIMPQLASLGRAVYAIDMLGYGLSEHPWPADTSIWGQADVLSFLIQQLNLTNIVLVGHGIGGGVAQVLATRLIRDRVAALVLIDTIAYMHAFAENWPLTDMAKHQDFDAPKHTELDDLIKNLRETLPNGSANPDRLQDSTFVKNYIEPWNSEVGKEVLFQHVRLMVPNYINSVSSDLGTLEKPTLIIWGEKDQQMPLRYAKRIHHEIEHSKLVVVPDAGHMILFDAPVIVASVLCDFIGSPRVPL